MLINILIWIGIGVLAGFLASKIVKGKGKGFWLNLLVGIGGAILGGWLWNEFGGSGPVTGVKYANYVNDAIVATGGATLLLFLIKLIFKK